MTDHCFIKHSNDKEVLKECWFTTEVYLTHSTLDSHILPPSRFYDDSIAADSSPKSPIATTCLCTTEGPMEPFHLSDHDSLHYDAPSHHHRHLQQSLMKACDPHPPYSTTAHAFEEYSSASLSHTTNASTKNEATQSHDPPSTINSFRPPCKNPECAARNLTPVLKSNNNNAKRPASPESFQAHKARSRPRHVSPAPTNEISSIIGEYSNTIQTCENTRALLQISASDIEQHAPIIGPAPSLWILHTTTSSGTLEAHAGSDMLSDIECPACEVDDAVGRPQLMAWIQQRCAKVMTLSEKMEMNKYVWSAKF